MSKDKREGWLKELTVNDTVVVWGLYREYIAIVTKITPTGRITVNGEQVFDPQGIEVTRNVSSRYRLAPLTREAVEKIERREHIELCQDTFYKADKHAHLNLDQLRKITNIIKGMEV